MPTVLLGFLLPWTWLLQQSAAAGPYLGRGVSPLGRASVLPSQPPLFCVAVLYAEYIIRNAGLEEAQAGIKIAGRNINNLRYADDTTLMTESEEELKSLLMKAKEENEKVGLKLNIQKTKIMASGPITSWEIDGEPVETVADFIFLVSKITADGDCSHEMKTLAPWKKSYDQPRQHIIKQRCYFANKDLVKAMVFLVVRYGCESWTIKKA